MTQNDPRALPGGPGQYEAALTWDDAYFGAPTDAGVRDSVVFAPAGAMALFVLPDLDTVAAAGCSGIWDGPAGVPMAVEAGAASAVVVAIFGVVDTVAVASGGG